MRREQAYGNGYHQPKPPPDPNKPLLAELRELWSLAGEVAKRPTRFRPDDLSNFNARAWAAYAAIALVVWGAIISILCHFLGYHITKAILGLMEIGIVSVFIHRVEGLLALPAG